MEYETLFPLYWICGEWKSNRKSPPVTVFRDGGAYKIALTYHLDAVVVGTIHQSGGIIWADLLGRVQLAYDREEDRLVLATEGDSFKVTALFLCGFPFLTLCPLAVTFCRVAVTPQPCGGFFGEIALFGLVALPAV